MAKQRKRALTFQQIKDADDRPLEPFEVLEWGGLIYLKPLSGEQMVEVARLVDESQKKPGGESSDEQLKFTLKLCGECIVDETERKVFTGKEIEVLYEKNFGVVQRIGRKILDMHGMTDQGMEEKKTA